MYGFMQSVVKRHLLSLVDVFRQQTADFTRTMQLSQIVSVLERKR